MNNKRNYNKDGVKGDNGMYCSEGAGLRGIPDETYNIYQKSKK